MNPSDFVEEDAHDRRRGDQKRVRVGKFDEREHWHAASFSERWYKRIPSSIKPSDSVGNFKPTSQGCWRYARTPACINSHFKIHDARTTAMNAMKVVKRLNAA